jgi:hypothetical protein
MRVRRRIIKIVIRTLEVNQIALLVKAGRLKTERVDDAVDLDGGILKLLLGLLSRGVGTSVYNMNTPVSSD